MRDGDGVVVKRLGKDEAGGWQLLSDSLRLGTRALARRRRCHRLGEVDGADAVRGERLSRPAGAT